MNIIISIINDKILVFYIIFFLLLEESKMKSSNLFVFYYSTLLFVISAHTNTEAELRDEIRAEVVREQAALDELTAKVEELEKSVVQANFVKSEAESANVLMDGPKPATTTVDSPHKVYKSRPAAFLDLINQGATKLKPVDQTEQNASKKPVYSEAVERIVERRGGISGGGSDSSDEDSDKVFDPNNPY